MHFLFFYDANLQDLHERGPRLSEFHNFKGFGGCGMDIFFVISGFIMAYLFAIRESRDIKEFAVRRITRIVPIYWLLTLFATFFLYGKENVPTLNLLQSLFFVLRPDNTTVIGPGWSLNFEMFYYAVFGITMLVLRRSFLWIAVLFLVMNVAAVITGNYALALYTDPLSWCFFFGIVIFHIHRSPIVRRDSTFIFVSGVLLLLSSIYWHIPDSSHGVNQFLPWGVPSMLIVLGAVGMEVSGKGKRIFESRILLAIGQASYSLYLLHTLLFSALSKVFLYQLHVQRFVTLDGAMVVVLSACCLIAVGVYHWVEKPSIKYSRIAFAKVSGYFRRASTVPQAESASTLR